MADWQPIETAPTDNQVALLAGWTIPLGSDKRKWHQFVGKVTPYEVLLITGEGEYKAWFATHWQPLPEPPMEG